MYPRARGVLLGAVLGAVIVVGVGLLLHFARHNATLLDNDPIVLSLAAQRRRIDRDWRGRINALLGFQYYDAG